MSFLKRPFKAVFGIFSPTKNSASVTHSGQEGSQAPAKRSAAQAFESSTRSNGDKQRKRLKAKAFGVESMDDEIEEPCEIPILEQPGVDRALMPPPSKHQHVHRKKASTSKAPRLSLDQVESASQVTRSSRAAKSDVMDEYDMEEARRKAAATQLPLNSGIWETGERELFFHLSYRGFEPILPKNWMIDFPTLPLPVFAHQESDQPLIVCHRSTQFRGIRALRELIDTGTLIRDRTQSSHDLRTEPILEKAVNKYIVWALKDLGYPRKPSKTTIPVHTIATVLPGQATQDVIRKLASEMHILAAKHREAVNVKPSVEQLDRDTLTPPNSQLGPTQIHPDRGDDERSLPVIYGIMIASSILAIFTLNSHTPFPPFLVRTLIRNNKSTLTPERAAAINPHLPDQLVSSSFREQLTKTANKDEDSGIRYIANFDFSNPSADVWNALVVAILAMQIRKTMGEVFETWQSIRRQQNDQSPLNQGKGASEASDDYVVNGNQQQAVEDSWLSNVNEEWTGLVPSSPALDLVDDLLSSPSRPHMRNISKGKAKFTIQDDSDDPDA